MVAAAGHDHGQERSPRQCHAVRLLHYRGEAEHFGIHFQRGDGARGDDDGAEPVENGLDGNGGVEAGEVKHRVGNGGGVGFVRFENQEKARVIRGG